MAIFFNIAASALLGTFIGFIRFYLKQQWYKVRFNSFNLLHKTGLSPGEKALLTSKFPYYRFLGYLLKIEFEKRLLFFIHDKKFIIRSRIISEVTREMQIEIGAIVVQISLGLPALKLMHFNRILIYDDAYYNKITRKMHQGEVNQMGLIVLSWAHFQKGIENPYDGKNLGLHEFAHAIKLENSIENREYDFISGRLLGKLEKLFNQRRADIKNGLTALRPYAGTNLHEFFACGVEWFFEAPRELKDSEPELYKLLCRLLKQDPLFMASQNERITRLLPER